MPGRGHCRNTPIDQGNDGAEKSPTHSLDQWEYYDNALFQALTMSGTGLGDSELTKPLLYETSGYQILWRLAYVAKHPRLVESHI